MIKAKQRLLEIIARVSGHADREEAAFIVQVNERYIKSLEDALEKFELAEAEKILQPLKENGNVELVQKSLW